MQEDPFSLDRLRDIVEPGPVSWWPPAAFWWCLIALAAIWMLYGITSAIDRWFKNAYRRQALRELAALKHPQVATVSQILKRVAMVSFSRDRVASLSGEGWLQFLDQTCERVDFQSAPVNQIGTASRETAAGTCSESDWHKMIAIARNWITNHQAEAVG